MVAAFDLTSFANKDPLFLAVLAFPAAFLYDDTSKYIILRAHSCNNALTNTAQTSKPISKGEKNYTLPSKLLMVASL